MEKVKGNVATKVGRLLGKKSSSTAFTLVSSTHDDRITY